MKHVIFGMIIILLSQSIVFAQMALDLTLLREIIADYRDYSDPAVVVFVEDNGVSVSAAYGLANLATQQQATVTDLFRIASTSKPMVATVLLSLVDAGEVSLDDPIANYLDPELVRQIPNAEQASVRQILQMSSGIFNYTESDSFAEAVENNPSYAWTAAEALAFAYGEASYFAAGEDYYYSNSNYLLAELIIEEVMNMPLVQALEEIIFRPLGMQSCFLETPDRFAKSIVRGYGYDDRGRLVDMTEINDGVGLGDGGVICNAADLATFPKALWQGELLSAALLAEMLSTVADGEGGSYGLGIGYEQGDFGWVLAHDGASSGFQSDMLYLPDEDITVTLLTNNFDADDVEDIVYDVLEVLFDN